MFTEMILFPITSSFPICWFVPYPAQLNFPITTRRDKMRWYLQKTQSIMTSFLPDQDSMLSYRSLLNDNQTIHLEFPKATNTIVSSLLLIESSCRSPLLAPILLCLFKDKPCDFCLSWADDYSLFIFSILPS